MQFMSHFWLWNFQKTFFEGHILRVYKNVMLDRNWDTHNRNIPHQYIFSISLLISLFFVFTVICSWLGKTLRILWFVLLTNFDYFHLTSFIMWIKKFHIQSLFNHFDIATFIMHLPKPGILEMSPMQYFS